MNDLKRSIVLFFLFLNIYLFFNISNLNRKYRANHVINNQHIYENPNKPFSP